MTCERTRSLVAVVVALLLHALLAAGLALAQNYKPENKIEAITVSFHVERNLPPVLEPEPQSDDKPEPRKAPVKEMQKLSKPPESPPEPPEQDVPPEDLAPGEASEEPLAAEYIYKMDNLGAVGTMAVAQGKRATGNLYGSEDGKDDGKGGGGDSSTGTRVATVASIKTMPKALGDNDFMSGYAYPPVARKAKIEGQVSVRLLIGKSGEVTVLRIVKGPGYGLNAEAKKLAKKLRFEPARDENDRKVAVRITWTFNFSLPE